MNWNGEIAFLVIFDTEFKVINFYELIYFIVFKTYFILFKHSALRKAYCT